MKKTIFVAVLLAVSATVFAQTEADFAYELNTDNDGIVIVGYKGTAVRVTIPATIEGFPVKEIGPYAFSPGKEQTINGSEARDAKARTFATNLYSLTSTWTSGPFPNMIAAKLTYKLTSVVIPEGVTKIGSYAFAETGPKTTFSTTVTHTLASVTIPGTVTEIGEYAFQSCEKLAALALPPSLTTLGKGSFGACKSLKTVTVPEGVTVLPEGVFNNCSALSGVTLPQSLTTIEDLAFADCTALAAITIPDGVTSIKGGSYNRSPFIRSGLTSVNWPAKIPVIPMEVFRGLNLKTMVIPEGVTDIGGAAFADCKSLTGVTLPSTIRNIHTYAFLGCSALTTVTIPDPVASISFPPPDSRYRVNTDAFKGCSKLGLATQAKIKQLGYTGTFQ